MIHFDCDYMGGAHPEILAAIVRNNEQQTAGYGYDTYTEHAKTLIREACATPDAAVYLLIGGTQTNSTVLSTLLKQTEGVISTESAHINVHESGAVEIFGHKVIALPGENGKLKASDVRTYLEQFYADDTYLHMVAPGAVYISFPTELGTLYSRKELEELHEVCREYHIPLYLDGARLGFGLAASKDLTLEDIARLTDVFYIGGTKMGALLGEAVVCTRPELLPHFFTVMKAHGAVLAKGRLLGEQFEAFFTNRLYFRIGEKAIKLAMELKQTLLDAGYKTFIDSPTNQQFFILPNEVIDKLMPQASFEYWGPRGEKESKVRFVIGWENTEADIETLKKLLK